MLYLIFTQQITVGQFFSLFIYSFFIFGPLQELGNVINIYRETEASLANFEAILQDPREPAAGEPGGRWTTCARSRSTTSASRTSRPPSPALGDVTFAVARGETIAFVGPSGSGQDDAGQAAGRPVPAAARAHPLQRPRRATRVDLDRLRERIGFVTQDTQLFSGTIRENLLFVRPDATDAECLDVLHQAAVRQRCSRAPTRGSTR